SRQWSDCRDRLRRKYRPEEVLRTGRRGSDLSPLWTFLYKLRSPDRFLPPRTYHSSRINHRIDTGRSTRGEVACEQRHHGKKEADADERDWITRHHAVKDAG